MKSCNSKPSNSMIERLIRDLWSFVPPRYADTSEVRSLELEAQKIEEELLSDARLKRIRAKIDRLRIEAAEKHESVAIEIRKLRSRFLANGASKKVVAEAKALAEKLMKQ